MAPRQYALTAMGMVNALGSDHATIKARLLAGETGQLQAQAGWLVDRRVVVGAVNTELPALPAAFKRDNSRNNRLMQLAYKQIEAEVQAQLRVVGPSRIGVVLGSSTTGIAEGEVAIEALQATGDFPHAYHYEQQALGNPSATLAALAGATGPAYTISTACSSSAQAFGSARNLLSLGLCDAVIVGGVDTLCKLTLQGFASLGAISKGHCNPMSQHRDGINIGEAAALFLMTRNPTPGEICLWGVGASSDAHHISAPDPTGAGAARAIQAALDDAGLTANDIGYINLHGTATPLNDKMESLAVHGLFGAAVPCSSTKPLVGHTLGAAGATELGFCWLLLQGGTDKPVPLPPHPWDGAVDEALAPLLLADKNTRLDRTQRPFCLSNSFAFGGNNCAVIVGPSRE